MLNVMAELAPKSATFSKNLRGHGFGSAEIFQSAAAARIGNPKGVSRYEYRAS
jgi:hypothetical protein